MIYHDSSTIIFLTLSFAFELHFNYDEESLLSTIEVFQPEQQRWLIQFEVRYKEG